MHPTSEFLLPQHGLSSCIFAAIYRDTRAASLSDSDRFNHFPASPLVSVTFVIEGNLRLVSPRERPSMLERIIPLPQFSVTPPQDTPTTSWSPGPVAVVSVAFYPEAWSKLEDVMAVETVQNALSKAFQKNRSDADVQQCWAAFCDAVQPVWQASRAKGGLDDWAGSTRLSDWSRSLVSRVALAGPGRSVRAFERRLKRWSNQSRKSLKFFSDFENLHRRVVEGDTSNLAGLATESGYSDQSHMGRAVRRATGFSPAQLNRNIESDEAFWCYRLLGERF
jgi:hypothetical protein